MAKVKESTLPAGNAKSAAAAVNPAQTTQDKTLRLRLVPTNNSDQPVVSNTSNIHIAPGMAYIDFGFIEPGVLIALPRMAQRGAKMPDEISGKLAVRVLMGYDGLANLQQQLTRVLGDLAKAKQEHDRK